MHDAAALMLEAAVNSIEAGAGAISVSVSVRDGMADIRVEDDGAYTLSGDPFLDGSTTKGEGRGRGLSIIKEKTDGRCRLTRGEKKTVLCFTAEDDGSMDDLFSALLPLFNLDKAMTVSIKRSSGEIVVSHAELEKRGAVPVSAQGIKAFRTFVNGLEKGENYG